MTKSWSDIKDRYPVSDEARAAARLQNLADDFGVALSQLRQGEDMTQVELAHRLLVTQPTVSEIERTGSPSVPTVRRYVEALGARLELIAVFDDGRRVALDPNGVQSLSRPASSARILVDPSPNLKTPKRGMKETGMSGKGGQTGKLAASAAGKTLGSGFATKSAKSAAGSALAQSKSSSVTSKKAASSAAKTLTSKSASKSAKSAPASALSQRPSKRGK